MTKTSLHDLLMVKIKFLRVFVHIDLIRKLNTSILFGVTCKLNTALSPIYHFHFIIALDVYHFSYFIISDKNIILWIIIYHDLTFETYCSLKKQRNKHNDYCENNRSENITLNVMARYQF